MKKSSPAGYVMLGFLMTDGMHGYELTKCLKEELGDIWHVGSSQVYLLLQKLEKEGLVISRLESVGNRPLKKTLRITETGRSAFLQWVQSPTRHLRDFRMEFMTKLYFFRSLQLAGGSDLLTRQEKMLENLKQNVARRRTQVSDAYRSLTLGFKMVQFDVCLQWLQEEAVPYMRTINKIG